MNDIINKKTREFVYDREKAHNWEIKFQYEET